MSSNLTFSERVYSFVTIQIGEKWQELIVGIEDDFASGSHHYTSLVQFVRGDAKAPTTGGALGGLPYILPRAGMNVNKPSLLFLNLPESSETQEPPSTADKALEKIHRRVIPLLSLFGVSGCGKTRTAIEMLSKQWGFYFNGSETDLGSNDLLDLLELVQQRRRYHTCDWESNTHVQILALALVLARIIILDHCLNVAEREGVSFTCRHWMLLQVGFRTMGVLDLFANLFTSIAKVIHLHSINIDIMSTTVQRRLSDLRQRLVGQRVGYKILLVVDEAQNLGKEDVGTFVSQQMTLDNDNKGPILSPLVHGFYKVVGDRNEICVIPCGTGLSIFDKKWLDDSAPGPKGYKEQLGPFTDFVGWESLEQIQSYRDLVRRSLPNDEARTIFDSHVPLISMQELFESLHGRFRPIVFAIGKQG